MIPVWNVARERDEVWPPDTLCAVLPEGYELGQVAAAVDIGDRKVEQYYTSGGRFVNRRAPTALRQLNQVRRGDFCLVEARPLWHLCRVAPPGVDVPTVS